MGNEEFSKELQGLKSRSEIPSTYEDVAGNWLSLLERIRGFYQDGNNSDPAYLEAREFCSSLIGKIRAYVKVDSYEKRLTDLTLPYQDHPYIEPSKSSSLPLPFLSHDHEIS